MYILLEDVALAKIRATASTVTSTRSPDSMAAAFDCDAAVGKMEMCACITTSPSLNHCRNVRPGCAAVVCLHHSSSLFTAHFSGPDRAIGQACVCPLFVDIIVKYITIILYDVRLSHLSKDYLLTYLLT